MIGPSNHVSIPHLILDFSYLECDVNISIIYGSL